MYMSSILIVEAVILEEQSYAMDLLESHMDQCCLAHRGSCALS